MIDEALWKCGQTLLVEWGRDPRNHAQAEFPSGQYEQRLTKWGIIVSRAQKSPITFSRYPSTEELINRIQSFITGALLLTGCTLVGTIFYSESHTNHTAQSTHSVIRAIAPTIEMVASANEQLVIRAAIQPSPTLSPMPKTTNLPTLSPTLSPILSPSPQSTSTAMPTPTSSPLPPPPTATTPPRPTAITPPLPTSAPPAVPVAGFNFTPQEQEELLLALLNQARRENGLGPLRIATELNASAKRHGIDMATHGLTWHTGSDGSIAAQRILDAGYLDTSATEMISYGHPNAAAAVAWWLSGDHHRPFILSDQYTEVGVSYTWTDNTDFGHYWVVNLGSR